MSLDRKDKRTLIANIHANRADFEGFADVLEQAADRLNVDIYPDNIDKDLPGRVYLKGKEVTALQYPRVVSALKQMSRILKEGGDGVVDFGAFKFGDRKLAKKSSVLRYMNSIISGGDAGKLISENLIDELESMVDFTSPRVLSKKPLKDLKATWVYAEDVVTHESSPEILKNLGMVKDLKELEKYPPDLNKKGIAGFLRGDKANRAYLMIMRTDRMFPMDMAMFVDNSDWSNWVRDLPVPEAIGEYVSKPPVTYGNHLELIAAYSAARTFDLKNPRVAPVSIGMKDDWDFMGDSSKKIHQVVNVPVMEDGMMEYANFYMFLVVGEGPKRPIDISRYEPTESEVEIPEFV